MLTLAFLLACVPKKDFDAVTADLAAERAAHAADGDAWSKQKSALEASLADELAKLEDLKAREAALRADLAAQEAEWTTEKARLLADRTQLKASVAEMEGALADAAARRASAEARVAEFRDLLLRFKKLIDAGQLKVRIVEGRMVVELATDVLFASGKADLSETGKAAITEVGAVLASLGDRQFQVGGHTDNDAIKTDRFPSNWELASARAIVVVRTLIAAGVQPSQVSAASFADTHPVADNGTPEGKASNRRIEISVVPDLSELPGFDELKAVGK
jgi:chemotaxis protein MotB